MRQLQTATLSSQNISAALLASTYTADADRAVMIRVVLDVVAGNGDYKCWITVQQAGAGSAYQVGPITTFTVATGVTAIAFTSIMVPLNNTDVCKVYVLGLAGDNANVNIITRFYELDYVRPTIAGRTLDIASTGEVGLDFTNRLDTTGILPNAAAGGVNGLPTVDASNYIAGIVGTLNQLDDLNNAAAAPAMITSQNVRDAMKLAPTAGAPDVGSIDKHLDDIPTNPYTGTPPAMITGQQVRDAMLLAATAPGVGAEDSIDDKIDDISAGGGLDAQGVRDAMKLAPTEGAPAVGSVDDHLDDLPANTWLNATRTLTSTAAATAAAITGSVLTITNSAGYAATLSGLTIPATWTGMLFSIKASIDDADASSVIQIRESNPGVGTDGLKILNAATALVLGSGSLVVNQAAGTVAIALTAACTAQLGAQAGLVYDLKLFDSAAEPSILTASSVNIVLTPTRAIV